MTKEQAMEKQRMAVRNIRWMIKKQGKELGELEDYCGVSSGYISRCVEGSNRRMSLVLALMAADFLETTLDELLSIDLAKQVEIEDIDARIAELQKRRDELTKEDE